MATGGWGAMGGGAWGGAPAAPQHDDDDSPRAAPPPSQPTFGASYNPSASYRAAPLASPTPAPVGAAPSFKNTPSFGGSSSNREAELRKKEAELEAREKRVAEAEKDLERTGVSLKKKNWPICFPIWRHNIGEDIPERSRRVVREAYLCWYLLILCLTYQFFCASVMLGYGVSNKVPSWFLSIIFWVMGVPLSIWLWYKRIYNAARDESSFGFISFFIFFFCHWAFCVFCAIAPQINAAQWCFSGFMTGFSAFDASAFAGTIYMIGGAAWGALALYSMWVLKDCWFFFRGQGGVQEVKQKAAQEAALAAFKQGMSSNRV